MSAQIYAVLVVICYIYIKFIQLYVKDFKGAEVIFICKIFLFDVNLKNIINFKARFLTFLFLYLKKNNILLSTIIKVYHFKSLFIINICLFKLNPTIKLKVPRTMELKLKYLTFILGHLPIKYWPFKVYNVVPIP